MLGKKFSSPKPRPMLYPNIKSRIFTIAFLALVTQLFFAACSADSNRVATPTIPTASFPIAENVLHKKEVVPKQYYVVEQPVIAGDYFEFIETVIAHLDTSTTYPIDEYVLMRANPWLIENLAATDYYVAKEKGVFLEDPKAVEILGVGDSLLIPNSDEVRDIRDRMAKTVIDVNIPEFVLRIKEGAEIVHQCSVRVGKDTQRYLAMAGRDVDLRTQPGVGTITRINRDAAYINPRNNKRYSVTRRDDKKVTQLPRIPWLEPTINGQRFGQLIHPTTNVGTLGKAYSNGCIGTSEADAWRIYFHAPLGTKVQLRYDLNIINQANDTIQLKDIYPGFKKTKHKVPVYASFYTDIFKSFFAKEKEVLPEDYCGCDLE